MKVYTFDFWLYIHYKTIKIFIRIFIVAILFSKTISAQHNISSQLSNYQFDHLTYANGLSFDDTRCILKDKQGFIWIATLDGLNKFDGINFKIYHHDEHNVNSPASNEFGMMSLDSKGNIWMASADGLIEYFPATDRFKNFLLQPNQKQLLLTHFILTGTMLFGLVMMMDCAA